MIMEEGGKAQVIVFALPWVNLNISLGLAHHGQSSIDSTEGIETSKSKDEIGEGAVSNSITDFIREFKITISIVLKNIFQSFVRDVGIGG